MHISATVGHCQHQQTLLFYPAQDKFIVYFYIIFLLLKTSDNRLRAPLDKMSPVVILDHV